MVYSRHIPVVKNPIELELADVGRCWLHPSFQQCFFWGHCWGCQRSSQKDIVSPMLKNTQLSLSSLYLTPITDCWISAMPGSRVLISLSLQGLRHNHSLLLIREHPLSVLFLLFLHRPPEGHCPLYDIQLWIFSWIYFERHNTRQVFVEAWGLEVFLWTVEWSGGVRKRDQSLGDISSKNLYLYLASVLWGYTRATVYMWKSDNDCKS